MEKQAKIMVTGARGLVGSAVVDLLKHEGYTQVVPVSRQVCDLVDQKQTLAFIQDVRPDYIFHAAARVYGIMGNMCNKARAFYENTLINTHVVHGAYLAGTKKITVMGTACVYPYPSPGPILKENMIFSGRPHESENSYAQAKRAMLAMCEAYQESHHLKWAYIVSNNLFGLRDKFDTKFGHVVPSLVKKFYDAKQKGKKVSVWGDGSAKRDFLYVKDAARACLEIMRAIEGPCNMGSGTVYTIRQIVDMLAQITDMADAIEWDRTKPNGQDHRFCDLSRLNAIGFQTKWSIQAGLQETWEWYCNHVQDDSRKDAGK